jgi:hypothetical protein
MLKGAKGCNVGVAQSQSPEGRCIMRDEAHQQRNSDHNEGNLTHDPANGVDCNVLADLVIDDPRVTYVIWNGQIYNRERRKWIKYNGANQHTEHMHVSIDGMHAKTADRGRRQTSSSRPRSHYCAQSALRGLFWHVVTTRSSPSTLTQAWRLCCAESVFARQGDSLQLDARVDRVCRPF